MNTPLILWLFLEDIYQEVSLTLSHNASTYIKLHVFIHSMHHFSCTDPSCSRASTIWVTSSYIGGEVSVCDSLQMGHLQIAYHCRWWNYIAQPYKMGCWWLPYYHFKCVGLCSSSNTDSWKCSTCSLCWCHYCFFFLLDVAIHVHRGQHTLHKSPNYSCLPLKLLTMTWCMGGPNLTRGASEC